MIKIGITECGDAGLDFSWVNKLLSANIIITKELNDECIKHIVNNKRKIILHLTCTGMGGSEFEPNVPDPYLFTYPQVKKLISLGFPKEQIVLRVDPIIPTTEFLIRRVRYVLDLFRDTQIKRVRYSFLDLYPHVKERFLNAKIKLPYNNFCCPQYMKDNALKVFKTYEEVYDFESCAEHTKHQLGCISHKDLDILGIKEDNPKGGFQRKGCLCLAGKTELLNKRKQCEHKCLYCYWK